METTTTTSSSEVVKPLPPTKSKKPLVVIALILALILCLCAVIAGLLIYRGTVATTGNAGSCTYNGVQYASESSFPSTDKCNTCTCGVEGIACTEKACAPAVSENPTPTPTPATPPAVIEETLIGKLLVTNSDYFYGTTKYPASIMNLAGSDLQAITCYENYGSYLGGALINSNNETITDSKINSFLNTLTGVQISSVSYCVTAEGKHVVQYASCTSQCGGGIGTNFYFGILENDKLAKTTLIPNQLGAYPKCDVSLALTKSNQFYVRCGGGETESTAAIYKIFLDNGNYTEIVKADY